MRTKIWRPFVLVGLILFPGVGILAQVDGNPPSEQKPSGIILPDSVERIEPWTWRKIQVPKRVDVSGLAERRAPGVPEPVEDYLARKERARFEPTAPRVDRPSPIVSRSRAEKSGLSVVTKVAGVSFAGLDFGSSANNATPPDTTLAKGSLRVLEGANRTLRLFNDDGTVRATADLNAFFGASTSDGLLFDPKVIFDRNATNKRFYMVALQKNSSTQLSKIWLAVSRSENPNTLNSSEWCPYSINGVRDAGTADASWADYPGLGVGADSVVISANQFRFTNSNYLTYAIVRVLSKSINNNAASCPSLTLYTFQPSPTVNNWDVFTLQAVQHYASPSSFSGATNPVYLVNTRYGSGSFYNVWRVRNVASGAPILDSTTVIADSYSTPPDAPQANSALLLETWDSRVTQAAAWSDGLWAVHATSCQNEAGANESCVRIVRLGVWQAAGGGVAASPYSSLLLGGGDDVFFWFAGIAVNQSEDTAVVLLHSSPTSNLSAAWSVKDLLMPFYPLVTTFATGACARPYSRTGDYVGAHLEPSGATRFWVAAEYASLVAGSCSWRTNIQEIVP